jgi:hypothetical protein
VATLSRHLRAELSICGRFAAGVAKVTAVVKSSQPARFERARLSAEPYVGVKEVTARLEAVPFQISLRKRAVPEGTRGSSALLPGTYVPGYQYAAASRLTLYSDQSCCASNNQENF